MGYRSILGCWAQPNFEYYYFYSGSKTMGAKLHCQKGNSPDCQLRSLRIG